MNKKLIIIGAIAVVILGIGAGVWIWKNEKKATSIQQEQVQKKIQQEQQKFVVDVDMDVNHWQTKETEYFTIKFPKEWYWLESIITNNPDFDINKYADIGIFTGGNYSYLKLTNNAEVIITDQGSATPDAGTPQDSIDAIFKLAKSNNPSVDCKVINNRTIPYTAYCAAVHDSQLQQSYYIINNEISLVIGARTTKDTLVKKEILDKIAGSIVLKKNL